MTALENFIAGYRSADQQKVRNVEVASLTPPHIENIQVSPISELELELTKSEHAFAVKPETLDKHLTILLEGNLNIALKSILAGKSKDLPDKPSGGDWQFPTAIKANDPEKRKVAREYAEASAQIHFLSRYRETKDKKQLYSLYHKQAFLEAKTNLPKAMKTKKWSNRGAKITSWLNNQSEDLSNNVIDPDYKWYLKHKKDIDTAITLQQKIALQQEKKIKLEDLSVESRATANQSGVSHAIEKVWFENNLKSRRRLHVNQAHQLYQEAPELIQQDILSQSEIIGKNGGDVRAAIGRNDNAFFDVGIYQILFPDYPQTWYDTPATRDEPGIPLSKNMEPVGYIIVSQLVRPDGRVLIQASPLKQVGSQAIDGGSFIGATGQKSASNRKKIGVPGAQNTESAPALDLLVNAALDANERKKINGALSIFGSSTNPGRIIGPVVSGVLDVGKAQETQLTDNQKNELLKGKWYDLDEVWKFTNGAEFGKDLPRTNSPFREALSEIWAQRYHREVTKNNDLKTQITDLNTLLEEIRTSPACGFGFMTGLFVNYLRQISKK